MCAEDADQQSAQEIAIAEVEFEGESAKSFARQRSKPLIWIGAVGLVIGVALIAFQLASDVAADKLGAIWSVTQAVAFGMLLGLVILRELRRTGHLERLTGSLYMLSAAGFVMLLGYFNLDLWNGLIVLWLGVYCFILGLVGFGPQRASLANATFPQSPGKSEPPAATGK